MAIDPLSVPKDPIGDALGLDLRFDGDLVTRGSGNLKLTEGLEGFRQVFERSLSTAPGEIWWTPEYGIGVTEFLGLPASAANAELLRNRIRASLQTNPDVEEIRRIEVGFGQELVEVFVDVKVKGVGQQIGPVQIRRV